MSALGRSRVGVSRNSPDDGKSAARPAIQPKRPRPPGRYVYAALAAIFTLFVCVGLWAALKPKLGSGYTSVAERPRGPRARSANQRKPARCQGSRQTAIGPGPPVATSGQAQGHAGGD